MSWFNAEAAVDRLKKTGIAAPKTTDRFYSQPLRALMTTDFFMSVPLAFRPGTTIRFSNQRAYIHGASGEVELVLQLRDNVADCIVDGKYFIVRNQVRNTVSIEAWGDSFSPPFFPVGVIV
jgi:hypothetical protein